MAFQGGPAESDQEILVSGYTARVDLDPEDHDAPDCPRQSDLRSPANPDWFNSVSDTVVAFLLPLLTALAGKWLFRLLFPSLGRQMPLLEQLAVPWAWE